MVEFLRRRSFGRKRAKDEESTGDAAGDFDPAFYRAFYADLAGYDDSSAALHWRQHGRDERRIADAKRAMTAHPAFARLPRDFTPIGYLYRNRDLGADFFNSTAAAWHFLDHGMGEGRSYAVVPIDPAFQAAYRRRWPVSQEVDTRLRWLPADAAQYLYLHGVDDAGFLARFDHDFYAALASADGADLRDRNASIVHFAEHGIERLVPIADDLLFDPAFHRRQLRRARDPDVDDAGLYRKWLARNDFEAYPPNHAARMAARFGIACAAPQVVPLGAYRLANADLAHLDDEALLEHVFTDGLFEQRTSVKITRSNAAVFVRYAAHLEASGETEQAEALFERLMHFVPLQPWLGQQYGDFLYRRGRHAAAFRAYRPDIEAGTASKWSYLNAADCCAKLSDLEATLGVFEAACRRHPDDQFMLRKRREAAVRHFEDVFAYAGAMAKSGAIAAAQAIAAAAAARCDDPGESTAPGRPIRTVGLFANLDLAQCNLYRVEQKREQLVAAGYAVRLYDSGHDQAAFHRELHDLDAVICYRVAAFPGVTRAINAARASGVVTFYEVDDLVFDADFFPGPFEDYAGHITSDLHAEIAMGVPLFRHALGLCDYAIASTPALARRMEPLVRRRRAFVHRNALGARHQAAVAALGSAAEERGGPVTIFYGSGTKAHKLDFERILRPALEEIERRFGPKVRFVVAGHYRPGTDAGVLSRVRYEAHSDDVETYWAALAEADISLSVLRRTPATDAKSEIKWLEAAMFAIPSVVGTTETFEGVVTDGVDGFLAADTAAFVDRIACLVRDPVRRRAMGEAARAKALRDYSVAPLADNLRAILADVTPRTRERTRILVVHVYYAPQAKGGATRVVIDNIRDLRALHPDAFEFEVFTTLEGGIEPYGVEVSSHDGVRTTAMVAGTYPDVDHTAHDPRVREPFARCVERFAPHLIHFHCLQRLTTATVDVARERDIPYLITVHDGWWISDKQFLHDEAGPARTYDFRRPPRLEPGPRARNDRQGRLLTALEGAAAVLAVSEPFAAIYRMTGLANVRAVPNGLPPMSPPRAMPPQPARTRVGLGHIGGLEAHKGYPLLKRAIFAAKPRNLSLVAVDLALEGAERLELWGETPVRIVPRRRQDAMAELYAEIDVLFAPSLWPESYGLVTREALAAGCWVVASDRGAIGEPVEEGVNGHVVSVADVSGLVAVLRRIDENPQRYLAPPPPPDAPMRTSLDQASDLAAIYREVTAAARRSSRTERVAGA